MKDFKMVTISFTKYLQLIDDKKGRLIEKCMGADLLNKINVFTLSVFASFRLSNYVYIYITTHKYEDPNLVPVPCIR